MELLGTWGNSPESPDYCSAPGGKSPVFETCLLILVTGWTQKFFSFFKILLIDLAALSLSFISQAPECWGSLRAQLFHGTWDLSSLTRDGTHIPKLQGGFLTTLPPGKSRVPILAFSFTTNACLKKGREKSKPPGTATGHIRSRRWLHKKKAYLHAL